MLEHPRLSLHASPYMTLRDCLTTFIRCLLPILLASCSTKPPASKGPVHEHDWGFMKFTEVRAFQLNWDDQNAMAPLLSHRGKFNKTRQPKEGILLNDQQVATLKSAVTGSHPEMQSARCFYPHHAFVFYGSRGGVTGLIEVCFLCQGWQPTVGFADHCDLNALETLVQDLEMPLSNPAWPMVRLWQGKDAPGHGNG
jgi:hypothetical protein